MGVGRPAACVEKEKSQAGGYPNLALATPLLTGYRFLPSAFLVLRSLGHLVHVPQGTMGLHQPTPVQLMP